MSATLNSQLFTRGSLADELMQHVEKAAVAVNQIPREQFLISTDDQIIEHVVSSLETEPIVLYLDQKTMESEETDVDVSGYSNRAIFGDGPVYVRGVLITISIPFAGDPDLWMIRPNQFFLRSARGNVQRARGDQVGQLEILIEHPSDEPTDHATRLLDEMLRAVQACLDGQRAEINNKNAELPKVAREAVLKRRENLRRNERIVSAFEIPLKRRDGAPDVTALPIRRKLVRPLPRPECSSSEPGIGDNDYAHILAVIRHEGRTFETTPATYAVHDEEDLRNILLAHLNGHYQGDATGETFRSSGKTDIRIENEKRNAFVAECKVWRGPSEFNDAIDQLLGYLTWRDCKAALVVFNKHNTKFSDLLSKVPQLISQYPLCRRELAKQDRGEWRYELASRNDEERLVTLHVFVFDLFVSSTE